MLARAAHGNVFDAHCLTDKNLGYSRNEYFTNSAESEASAADGLNDRSRVSRLRIRRKI
jgi:hypothetical protein